MATVAPRANGRTPRVAQLPVTDGPASLAQALQAFAAEAPKLRPNADGQIQNRTYRYVTLDGLLDDVNPLLLQFDLLWTAKVITQDGQPAALYRMEHVPSGDCEEWIGPLPCVDPGPQALGSAITYMRRYTLQAYLNLAPGEDDDGAGASPPQVIDRYAEAEAAHASMDTSTNTSTTQPTARPPAPTKRRITANQREKLLKPRAQKAGLTSGQFANVILTAQGEPTRTWTSQEHADQTLDRLLDQLEVRYKDAVLSGIDKAQVAKLAGSGQR